MADEQKTTKVKGYSVSPYNDDYFEVKADGSTAETKNYHKILYRPGYAVQARELTQMQTMLQVQIDRHGQYAFKDGSRVLNGEVTLNVEYDYIKLQNSFNYQSVDYTDDNVSQFEGSIITGTGNAGNQVKALVLKAVAATSSDPATLYIKYQSAGDDSSDPTNDADRDIEKFAHNEVFLSNASPAKYGKITNIAATETTLANGTASVGTGSAASIAEGVYFISGCFAYVAPETIILDKYTNNPSYLVGLRVVESIVDSSTDTSLVDNAQGTPNTSAPGANRYQIATNLIKQTVDAEGNINESARDEDSYIPLITVANGIIKIDKTDKTDGTGLQQVLAERTFDESGDYTVKPFELDIKEHLNDGAGNFGKYLASDTPAGDDNKIALGVEPSTAYVKGFRIEKVGTTFIDVDKPRGNDATAERRNITTQARLGNYVRLKYQHATDDAGNTGQRLKGVPDLTNFTEITLKEGGTTIGNARARGFEWFDDHARLYLFDIDVYASNKTFADVDNVSQALNGFSGYLDTVGSIFDSGNNLAIFQLPISATKSLSTLDASLNETFDTTYKVKKVVSGTVSSGALVLSTSDNLESVVDIIVSPQAGATTAGGSADTLKIRKNILSDKTAGGNGTNSITYDCSASGLNLGNSSTVKAIVTVSKTAEAKEKQRENNQVKTHTVTDINQTVYELDKSDIIRINSITDSSGDVKDRFTLDDGQRDNFYDEGRIIKIPGTPPLNGTLTINFDYYSHTAGDYFSVDSYPTADYKDIPTYSTSSGAFELRDCLDFRSTKAASGATDGSEFSTGSGSDVSAPPKPDSSITFDARYYLPRIDKLVLKRTGELIVVKGAPSDYPVAPADREDGLTLYELRLSPYVFGLGDIQPALIDNKRYTMRDISSLDARIKNLEYYTSLSLLEQSAADIHMTDSAGLTRLKNGIVVDSFRNTKLADFANSECSISVDKQEGILRPQFDERSVNLIHSTTHSGDNASQNDSIWTLPYSSVTFQSQPYASTAINVNPYNVFTWEGRMQLSPASDEWKEVDVRPDVIIDDDSQFEQFAKTAKESGILGTVWNEWETNWTGTSTSTSRERVSRQRRRQNFWWWRRGRPRFSERTQFGNRTTVATTTTTNQSREGMRTDLAFDTVTRESNNRVVEVNFVPFMRSRLVYFRASKLKPKTQVYAFFDNVNVTAYCKQTSSPTRFSSSGSGRFRSFGGRTRNPAHATSSAATGQKLITDNKGRIFGSFLIPRNDTLKFKTGTKQFRISDHISNNKAEESTGAEADFHAQGLIESVEKTITNTKVPRIERTRLSDERVLRQTTTTSSTKWIDPLAQTILIEKEGGVFLTGIDLFFKTKYTVKNGDDVEIPVSVSIVSTENGIPTQKTVPGTEVSVYPGDVNASANATQATSFNFDNPVYLQKDTEYAIVIQSDCDEYECWVAEMGKDDVSNPNYRITKQPHGGSFFTSQNASTWTPEQSKDLKFTLKRAEFGQSNGDLTATITFTNDEIEERTLPLNSLQTTNTSNVVTVNHLNHGMYGASQKVRLLGVTGVETSSGSGVFEVNGIDVRNLVGDFNIGNVTHNSYTITAGTGTNLPTGVTAGGDTAATATASGGGSAMTVTENRYMDLANIIAATMTVPGTDARFFLSTVTAKSIDGDESAGTEITANGGKGIEILPNENILFDDPMQIGSDLNDGSVRDFVLKVELSSDQSHLTPVLDQDRLSVITVQNIINNQGVGTTAGQDEAAATGGAALCKYITKKIELVNESDVIDVYMGINRPSYSTVDLYYKVAAAGSEASFDDIAWSYATPADGVPIRDETGDYAEVKFNLGTTTNPIDGSFSAMAFKIVMKSSKSTRPPSVKDFRAIAAT